MHASPAPVLQPARLPAVQAGEQGGEGVRGGLEVQAEAAAACVAAWVGRSSRWRCHCSCHSCCSVSVPLFCLSPPLRQVIIAPWRPQMPEWEWFKERPECVARSAKWAGGEIWADRHGRRGRGRGGDGGRGGRARGWPSCIAQGCRAEQLFGCQHRPAPPALFGLPTPRLAGGAAAAACPPASCTTCSAAPRSPAACATRPGGRPFSAATSCCGTCARTTGGGSATCACRCVGRRGTVCWLLHGGQASGSLASESRRSGVPARPQPAADIPSALHCLPSALHRRAACSPSS